MVYLKIYMEPVQLNLKVFVVNKVGVRPTSDQWECWNWQGRTRYPGEILAPPKSMGWEQQDSTLLGSPHLGLLAFPSSSCTAPNASVLLQFAYICEKGSWAKGEKWRYLWRRVTGTELPVPSRAKGASRSTTRVLVPVNDQSWKTGCG